MSVVVKQVLGQEMVEYFYSIIMSLLDYYLPFVRRYSFNCDKPWVTSEFRNLTKRRQIAFLSGQFSLYRKLRNQTKSSTTEAVFALALFVDFRKAFDIINHNVLFSKLNNFNIPHCLLKWFVSYLSLRCQRDRVGHQVSSWRPWGSIRLGPLSFIVMIDDLRAPCEVHKFVDDTTVSELIPPRCMLDVCLSVCLSLRHTLVLCQNGSTYRQLVFTAW